MAVSSRGNLREQEAGGYITVRTIQEAERPSAEPKPEHNL